MSIQAKPVVKNKYWIVEDSGRKIATIQAAEDGVVLVQNDCRLKYPSIKVLGTAHNIRFVPGQRTQTTAAASVYDYPSRTVPHNAIYDLRLRLPIYTESAKSKSYYCAGYYLILIENTWTKEFCPKKIILQRYEFRGPFRDKSSMDLEFLSLTTHK